MAAASLPAATGFGRSKKTLENYDGAIGFIDKYLAEKNFPPFKDLEDEHVEADHLENLIENIGWWFAETRFRTNQNTWLGKSSKHERFKQMKECFKLKFKDHELFEGNQSWFADLLGRFDKTCDRLWIQDPNISEERKSEPLYRDLDQNRSAIRAKYMGFEDVDAKTISMSMIRKGDKKSSGDLLELSMVRHGVGRGGEHVYLRWNEATYDPFFRAPDFDWKMSKQSDRQCMVMFCDRHLYCLCPFFAFGVSFMFGGARRASFSAAVKDFVFPYLHSINKDGVARKVTTAIQNNIPNESRRKAFTSRSTRKGAMTEMRMNRDLVTQEEYARSGHTAPGSNTNAEGYVESTPAMNAPGGMAMAGYLDCHQIPSPYNLECLGCTALEAVERLLGTIFVIEVPELQVGGKLRAVTLTALARLIGSYNSLVSDVGTNNNIVKSIMVAAQKAKIDDTAVAAAPGPRWHVVLKDWSRRIQSNFEDQNPECVSEDASLTQQVISIGRSMESFGRRMGKIENMMAARETDTATIDLLSENNQLQARRIEQLVEENARLKRQLGNSSPRRNSPDRRHSREQATGPNNVGANEETASGGISNVPWCERSETGPQDALNDFFVTFRPTKKARSTNINDSLDGIAETCENVGGITVSDELERLWKTGAFSTLKSKLADDDASRKALFDRSHAHSVPIHPAFIQNSEMATYECGMTLVAMAIESDEWEELLKEGVDEMEHRRLLASIEKSTMGKAYQLEVENDLRQAGSNCKMKPTIHSLGTRFRAIRNKWKSRMSLEEVNALIDNKTGGKASQKQSRIMNFFVRG